MDWEIFGFLVFVVIYLVATISEKTKKRREKVEKRMEKQTVLPAQAFESEDSQKDDLPEEQPAAQAAFDDPCDEEEKPRIHLHRVTEQELEAAQEGEDPCHAGGEGTAPHERYRVDDAPEMEPEELRQGSDVLRGIIMSEILMRPAERAALRRIRRGKRT